MYNDTQTKQERMRKEGSASSKNLLGKLSSSRNEAKSKDAMRKVLNKKKAK